MTIFKKLNAKRSTLNPKNKGFTLIELLIVIGITLVLAAASSPLYGNLQVSSQLNESTTQLVQTLRTAREYSASRLNNAQHGVYLEINPSVKDRYILYQGNSYSLRDTSYDRAVEFDEPITLSTNLSGSGDINDINFKMGFGAPNKTGTITITHSVNGTRQISINRFGLIEEN